MRITLDYCRKCYGIFNKINAYLELIFCRYGIISWLLVAIIIASCGFLHFEADIKEQLVYPSEAYNELEKIAVSHAQNHQSFADFSTFPDNLHYTCSISEEEIISTYSIPAQTKFFFNYIVTVEQRGDGFTDIDIYRNFEEETFISEFRKLFILVFSIILLIISLAFVGFLMLLTSLLNRIGLEERRKKYFDLYYRSYDDVKTFDDDNNTDT